MKAPSESKANSAQPSLPGTLHLDETRATAARVGRRSLKRHSSKGRSSGSSTSRLEGESGRRIARVIARGAFPRAQWCLAACGLVDFAPEHLARPQPVHVPWLERRSGLLPLVLAA
ncbi:hypothetical protein MTO96_017227 [Rhipicephalus appendiculatus]